MRTNRKPSNETGAALVVALGVVSIMVIIGVTVTALSMNSSSIIGHDTRLTESQNIAEAGIDEVIAVSLANFYDIYPGGYLPDAGYPGDGMPFYDGPQEVTDGQGAVSGTYEVWTKEDPDRPGHLLVTATGATTGANPETATVRVSVLFTATIFDYVLLPGSPGNPSFTEFRAGRSDDSSSETAGNNNLVFVGNVHFNGSAEITTPVAGDNSSGDAGTPGTVSFLSRPGYTDTVTYTDSFTGDTPTGNWPVPGDPVSFPTIDFSSFSNTFTVMFPMRGVPAGGWTRGSGTTSSVFTISAEDFEDTYGDYDVVIFDSIQGQVEVQITGNCSMSNPAVITPTLMVMESAGRSGKINRLSVIGPGVSLQPDNGLAILAAENTVQFQDNVIVGSEGAGALIFIDGSGGDSDLEVNGSFTMHGSIVVNGEVAFGGITGDYDSRSDDRADLCRGCGDHGSDTSSGGHREGAEILVTYDPGFLSSMPPTWWDGGDMTAVKVNFERD